MSDDTQVGGTVTRSRLNNKSNDEGTKNTKDEPLYKCGSGAAPAGFQEDQKPSVCPNLRAVETGVIGTAPNDTLKLIPNEMLPKPLKRAAITEPVILIKLLCASAADLRVSAERVIQPDDSVRSEARIRPTTNAAPFECVANACQVSAACVHPGTGTAGGHTATYDKFMVGAFGAFTALATLERRMQRTSTKHVLIPLRELTGEKARVSEEVFKTFQESLDKANEGYARAEDSYQKVRKGMVAEQLDAAKKKQNEAKEIVQQAQLPLVRSSNMAQFVFNFMKAISAFIILLQEYYAQAAVILEQILVELDQIMNEFDGKHTNNQAPAIPSPAGSSTEKTASARKVWWLEGSTRTQTKRKL